MKTADTIIPAWKMAVKNRPITNDLLFHSDRGVQYACYEFRKLLKSHPFVVQSMSDRRPAEKVIALDNAVAESFRATSASEYSMQS